jgi:hypothetical protein
MWHHKLGRFFELGTLYTVLAGMLNMLVIYDAWAGPMHPLVKNEKSSTNSDEENNQNEDTLSDDTTAIGSAS